MSIKLESFTNNQLALGKNEAVCLPVSDRATKTSLVLVRFDEGLTLEHQLYTKPLGQIRYRINRLS